MASSSQRTSTHRGNSRTLPSHAPVQEPTAPSSRELAKSNGHSDKHAEIFSAALRLFQEKGYHGASMQDLADAVGMQKASLYYYFKSKEDLLVLVCERGTGAFTAELTEIAASDLRATEKLRRAVEYHLIALCEQLDLFTVFLHEQKFLGDAQKKRLRGEGKRHAELLASILQQGIASGEFRKVNVTITTRAILGMCNWLYEWYSPEGALTPREIAKIFSEMILNGLAQNKAATHTRKKRIK